MATKYTNETLRESAEVVWGLARDLASPSVSGTSLNAERACAFLQAALTAFAHQHGQQIAAVTLAAELHDEKRKHREATAELTKLRKEMARMSDAIAKERESLKNELRHVRSLLGKAQRKKPLQVAAAKMDNGSPMPISSADL